MVDAVGYVLIGTGMFVGVVACIGLLFIYREYRIVREMRRSVAKEWRQAQERKRHWESLIAEQEPRP